MTTANDVQTATDAGLVSSRRGILRGAAALTAVAALGQASLAWAADKDTIKIGYISPKTGPFSPFAEADDFILDQVRKTLADGLVIGGKKFKAPIDTSNSPGCRHPNSSGQDRGCIIDRSRLDRDRQAC
ncbi:hypothetical protein WKW79_33845, partial [Variovorax robiniae]